MKFNIKSRDVKFFALGILAAFIFSVVYSWESNVKAFKEGYSDSHKNHEKQNEMKEQATLHFSSKN